MLCALQSKGAKERRRKGAVERRGEQRKRGQWIERTLLDSSDLARAKNLLSPSFLFFSSVSVITIHSLRQCSILQYDRIYASEAV